MSRPPSLFYRRGASRKKRTNIESSLSNCQGDRDDILVVGSMVREGRQKN